MIVLKLNYLNIRTRREKINVEYKLDSPNSIRLKTSSQFVISVNKSTKVIWQKSELNKTKRDLKIANKFQ